jgi:hypothetical protein
MRLGFDGRTHIIHLNFNRDNCTNLDEIEAYTFARVLDSNIMKEKDL